MENIAHATYVQALSKVQPVKCQNDSCGCGNWHCLLCDENIYKPVAKQADAKEHVTQHWKQRVEHKGKFVLRCFNKCDEGGYHYHCPDCNQIVSKKTSFVAHLECHRPIEVFKTVAAVVSPGLLEHIPGSVESALEIVKAKCGISYNLSSESWCVLQGNWKGVSEAHQLLHDMIILPVSMEVTSTPEETAIESTVETQQPALETVPVETPDENAAAENPDLPPSTIATLPEEIQTPENEAISPRTKKDPATSDVPDGKTGVDMEVPVTEISQAEVSNDAPTEVKKRGRGRPKKSAKPVVAFEKIVENSDNGDNTRRSARKRVLSKRFDEYAVPSKLRKTGPGSGDYEEFESLSEDEEEEDEVKIVTVNSFSEPNALGLESQNVIPSDCNVDSQVTQNESSDVQLNIEKSETGDMTVSLHMKKDMSTVIPMRKVVISKQRSSNTCDSCGKKFNTSKSYVKHIESGICLKAEDPLNLRCKVKECPYEASRIFDLKLHIERHHEEKKYECPICNKKFGPLYDLKIHNKYTGHNGGQKMERAMSHCPVCKKLIQRKNVNNHVRTVHQNIRPHKCDICEKAFWTRHLLKTHKESHKDNSERIRPYICEVCNQGFFAKMAYDDHKTKHTGTPKYSCDKCGKQFYYYTGWQRHLVSHSDSRPFSCEICKKSFKTSSNLYAHKQSHGQPTFICRCGKAYQHKHNLVAHARRCPMVGNQEIGETIEIDTTTAQRFMCGYCQETFTDFSSVQEHLSQHVVPSEDENVTMETELDASMLEHLAVAASEAGADNFHTLQQLAMTAMQQSEQEETVHSETILVQECSQDEAGTATSILETQQVLQDGEHNVVNILVTNDGDTETVQHIVLEDGQIVLTSDCQDS